MEYEEGEKTDEDPSFTVACLADIDLDDPAHVYLVDHAWTFQGTTARRQLEQVGVS